MRRAAALLALSWALTGCGRAMRIGTWPEAPIVLVSIDTLRSDHLSSYGFQGGSTSRLAALAREGIVFETAYSHCPLTLPSHASLFTGLLPPGTGVRDNLGFRLPDAKRTLAERLKSAGWSTGGAISALLLRRETGLARGFDFYDEAIAVGGAEEALGSMQRDGSETLGALLGWIEAHKGARLFAFLHLYEPHSPYDPPERYRNLASLYDGEVAYADELVGRLLDGLRQAGLYDRAIVAVVSDHGEGLLDHGEQEHGLLLYREALQVPFIMKLPAGVGAGRRVRGPVGLVDVAPTLLDLVGLPSDELDGRSLRAAITTGQADSHAVYAETLYPLYHFGWSDLRAATDGHYSYIQGPRPELFDLISDPAEKRDLVHASTSTATAMARWLEAQMASDSPAQPDVVSEDVRQKLRALGYVGGSAPAPAHGVARSDPKDKIAVYEDLMQSLALHREGKDAEAVPKLQALLSAEPAMFDAWEVLGLSLLHLDRATDAIVALERAVVLDPLRAEPHLSLAQAYASEHQLERAIGHAEIAAEREPGKAYEILARLLLEAGRIPQAAEAARKSVAADPARAMSLFVLGSTAQRGGRYEEAIGYFRKAEEANRLERGQVLLNLHASLADCLARIGREAEAEAEFQAEIKAAPWEASGRIGLAMLYRSQGKDEQAREVLSGLVAAQPKPDPDAYFAVVRTFSVLGDTSAARDWAVKAHRQFPGDPRFR
jgi:arylsulfatase A-like enzyme/tetratricopeptide (TPR) repeat protein